MYIIRLRDENDDGDVDEDDDNGDNPREGMKAVKVQTKEVFFIPVMS